MKTKHRVGILRATFLLLMVFTFPALTGAAGPPDNVSGVTVYMEIEEITTGIGEDGHENEVPITAAMHGIEQAYDPDTGMATGTPRHNSLDIVKPLDQTSPFFPAILATGQELQYVTVRFYRMDPSGDETHFYTIHLDIARVVLYGMEENDQQAVPYEAVSFVYEQATWTDVATGNSTSDHWGAF